MNRLACELPVLTEAKQKPFPQVRSSMIPKSLVSGPEWPSKGDKGLPQRNSKGFKGEKGFGGGSVDFGFKYDSGSNYGSYSKGSNYGGSSYGKGSGKGFSGRGPQFGKTILVVVKDILRIRAREIAAKEIRFYQLLRLRLLLLLQTGFISLHRLSVDLILHKAA